MSEVVNTISSQAAARAYREVCDAPQEVVDEANELVKDAINITLAAAASPISTQLVGVCTRVPTTAVRTLAVTAGSDHVALLLLNPHFVLSLAKTQNSLAKVLIHEALHLVHRHVYAIETHINKKDPVWTLAEEASINYLMLLLTDGTMPEADGKPTGIDPTEIYKKYAKDLKDQGLTPLDKAGLYQTDLTTYRELSRMANPPVTKNMIICLHDGQLGDEGDEDGQSIASGDGLDQDAVDDIVSGVLETVLHDAEVNKNKSAKEELMRIMERSEDSPKAKQMWGDIGANILRGEKSGGRKTDLWAQWLANAIGTKIDAGNKWAYNKKIPWNPQVRARGSQFTKQGRVYIDTSGSMHEDILRAVSRVIETTPGITIDWFAFDASIAPFEIGDRLPGGGGTSFQIIDDHVSEMDEAPDFVLVITDGYAPHIVPRDPELWIWLIVPHGDSWPESAGMDCRELDMDSLAVA